MYVGTKRPGTGAREVIELETGPGCRIWVKASGLLVYQKYRELY